MVHSIFAILLSHLLLVLELSTPSLVLAQDAPSQPDVVFVQSANAEIRKEPKMNAESILNLNRGDQLTVISKSGIWLQVQMGETKGWISKLFTSPNRPIGNAELTNQEVQDQSRVSRKRPKPKTVSAATRGLVAGKRGKEEEKYKRDPSAIKRIEKLKVKETEVDSFIKDGNLQ